MNSAPQLSIIFPCYNEQESVRPVLSEAIRILPPNSNVEILIVDDGSTDQTAHELRPFENSVRIIHHEKNLGYGAAIKTGLFYSKGATIAFMDFDGTCAPVESLAMLETLTSTNSDMVMGVRLHESSKMPKTRWVGNQLYKGLLKTLYPAKITLPKDVCTGFRLLKREVAENLFEGLPNDLSFSPALTAKALKKNYKITDHQITYSDRFGHSKISLIKDGLKFGQALVAQRFTK